MLYWYEQALNERATQETREIAGMLGLNESETQLIRQFAAVRLHAENEAEALTLNNPTERREANRRAAAQFQTRLVNVLNESQMQRYMQLLAATAKSKEIPTTSTGIAEDVARTSSPMPIPVALLPSTSPAPAAIATVAPAETAAPKVAPKPAQRRRYQPVGHYHTKLPRRK